MPEVTDGPRGSGGFLRSWGLWRQKMQEGAGCGVFRLRGLKEGKTQVMSLLKP